ncbi:hypothetical protein ACTQ54_11480 [Fundicoccus sp. Sow4_H7]|uniref:hypothetical protein n=1 Tax=Fundicoccus sp. Sow4_H7 TaxID=3438784 RepID=UPI003F90E60E
MRKTLKLLLSLLLLTTLTPINIAAHDGEDHNHEKVDSFSADDHHTHGTNDANFIPANILNSDDSKYVAPEETADHVGLYTTQVTLEELDVDVKIILNINDDGIFNLVYYFINAPEATGLRFYGDADGNVLERDAIYQDLVVLTAALREGDGGLTSGLLGRTNSPVVLLDEEGNPDRLYPYKSLAYDLRENYQNARVYQSVGVYAVDEEVVVDVNHLIGLQDAETLVVPMEKVETSEEVDAFLVEQRVYEMLQYSFDNDLVDHNDFKMEFDSFNSFLQKVLAMNLGTNASFPRDTTVSALTPEQVDLTGDAIADYAVLINNALIYAFDTETNSLYMSDSIKETEGVYTAEKWVTNN